MFSRLIHGILLRLASPSNASLHFRRLPDNIGHGIRMFFRTALLAGLVLASFDLRAAAREQTPEVGAQTVVRADRRTGRLVRRVVVPEAVIRPVTIEARPIQAAASGDGKNAEPKTPAPAAPVHSMNGQVIGQVIDQVSHEHGVDPLLVHAVIHAESRYNKYAISPKGAEGLMQLIPSTAKQMGVRNSFDTRQNVEGGVKYLRQLMGRFDDLRYVLAAYNAGPEAVARWGGIPPYSETQDYVYKVGRRYGELRRAQQSTGEAAMAKAPAQPVAPPEPEYRPLESFVDEQGRLHLRTR